MKIYCNRTNRQTFNNIKQEKEAYIADYNERKARYDKQTTQFNIAYDSYDYKIDLTLRDIFKDEIAQLPNLRINVKRSSSSLSKYVIIISNFSSKYKGNREYNYEQGERNYDLGGFYGGFSWNLEIRFIRNSDDTIVVNTNPKIVASLLQADDIEELQKTYAFMKKVNEFDWESLLNRIIAEIPKEEDYIKEPYPGELDTSEFDKQLSLAGIDNFVGKDIWFIAKYKEYSRSEPTSCAIRLLGPSTSSSAYYRGNIYTSYFSHINAPIELSTKAYNKYVNISHDIRKKGIALVEPVQCYTTEELFVVNPDLPSYW